MSDPTKQFFDDLAARGHVPLLNSTSGTLRFDLEGGGRTAHWYVTVSYTHLTLPTIYSV